jgi:hypothetical protein
VQQRWAVRVDGLRRDQFRADTFPNFNADANADADADADG